MVDDVLRDVPVVVETQRLRLRCPRPGDGVEVNTAVNESLAELRPWLSWARESNPVEITEANMRRAAADFILRKSFRYLIFLKDSPTLVGSSGLDNPNWDVPSFEIGYWARTRFAGQGYITEAVIALTEMAFSHLEARRIYLTCNSANVRSAALARRAGYHLEGVLRNNRRHPLTGGLVDTMVFSQVR